jgi:hypothetical protein
MFSYVAVSSTHGYSNLATSLQNTKQYILKLFKALKELNINNRGRQPTE